MRKKIFLFLIVFLFSVAQTLLAQTKIGSLYYNLNSSSRTASVTYYSNGSSSNSNYVSGSLTIPSSVTYSGTAYSVTSIGDYAFEGCSSLTSVTIPSSVTSIGDWAFKGCSGLKTVYNFSNLNFSKGSSSYGDVAYYADKVINMPGGEFAGDYGFYIDNGVAHLSAYIGNETELVLPDNYKGNNYQIDSEVFKNCSNQTSITIPSSVTSIGSSAFWDCSGLTSVTIPSSVTSIGSSAFYGCSSLASVTIPSSVTSIGSSAFSGCSGLTSITIPSSVTSIGSSAFSGCSSLTSVTIPSSVTRIGSSAFYGCSGLTSVTIPSNVTSIGSWAFGDCIYQA